MWVLSEENKEKIKRKRFKKSIFITFTYRTLAKIREGLFKSHAIFGRAFFKIFWRQFY